MQGKLKSVRVSIEVEEVTSALAVSLTTALGFFIFPLPHRSRGVSTVQDSTAYFRTPGYRTTA